MTHCPDLTELISSKGQRRWTMRRCHELWGIIMDPRGRGGKVTWRWWRRRDCTIGLENLRSIGIKMIWSWGTKLVRLTEYVENTSVSGLRSRAIHQYFVWIYFNLMLRIIDLSNSHSARESVNYINWMYNEIGSDQARSTEGKRINRNNSRKYIRKRDWFIKW